MSFSYYYITNNRLQVWRVGIDLDLDENKCLKLYTTYQILLVSHNVIMFAVALEVWEKCWVEWASEIFRMETVVFLILIIVADERENETAMGGCKT